MMKGNSVPVKAEGLMERVLGDDIVVLSPKGDILHTLSGTGRFIWEKIDGARTLDDVLAAITEEYQVDEQVAGNDLRNFVADLLDKSLIGEK